MKQKILHFFAWDKKFTPSFIDFIEANFDLNNHRFLIYNYEKGDVKKHQTIIKEKKFIKIIPHFIKNAIFADKIILHGLFNIRFVLLLFFMPWVLKKCYWVIWGGDLYYHKLGKEDKNRRLKEFLRRRVISKIGHFVTYIKGDYLLAQQWYGAKGQYHECIMYNSNVYKHHELEESKDRTINIIIGNSADPSNNHSDVFEKVKKYNRHNIRIYCPLSYGNKKYGEKISRKGKEIFGDKFVPLMSFIPFEDYLKLLSKIDIAIFAHKRQQAMGNTITLLGLGKKVYMRSDVTQWATLKSIGVNLFDYRKIMITRLRKSDIKINKKLIKNHFNEKKMKNQWSEIFYL